MKRLLLFALSTIIFSCTKPENKKNDLALNPLYEKAISFRNNNQADSAFKYFNDAKDFFLAHGDRFKAAKSLSNMAYISYNIGDYFGAQEISLQALEFFDKSDTAQHSPVSSTYNTLGRATHQLANYDKAIEFYQYALRYAKDAEDRSFVLNNLAKTFEETGQYGKAEKIYSESIKKTPKQTSNYARILNNIALTKWLQNPKYNAIPEFHEALRIRTKVNDLDGLNSSYARLSDYYANTKPDSSAFYARQMYQITKLTGSTENELKALRKLSLVSPPAESKNYYSSFIILLDSLDGVRNNASNKFALIRYESEKHKSELLLAQNENIKKRNNIVQLFFVTIVLLGILIFGYFVYRKRKRQLQQEKELEVKNTELKYVKKVHDRVANKVYQVISEVENIQELDKEQILDKLDAIYEISRDISYENTAKPYEDFSIKLASMLSSYKSEKVAINCEGNHTSLWQNVNEVSKEEVFLVIQELLTNMDKHSEASNVQIKIWQEDEQINIHYYDNGVGLPEGLNFNNGLNNTVSRINAIAGTITFESKNKNGLVIHIAFPTY